MMTFLRSLPLSRPSSLLAIARPFSSTCLAYEGAQRQRYLPRANKQPYPPSKPTSRSKIATSPRRIKRAPPPIPDISEPLPYHVHRTPSQQLPVYQLAKRGGNLLLTRLRKIDGDIMRLKLHLQQALDLRPEEISINQLTRHIHIKGWRRNEVKGFLQARNL
ncbi:MAG: hypothetical protein LQ345_005271 [Seirophora villosa]|nr:MAG: hypothetical protein LQ345_005271 [Seirophora villosa]